MFLKRLIGKDSIFKFMSQPLKTAIIHKYLLKKKPISNE